MSRRLTFSSVFSRDNLCSLASASEVSCSAKTPEGSQKLSCQYEYSLHKFCPTREAELRGEDFQAGPAQKDVTLVPHLEYKTEVILSTRAGADSNEPITCLVISVPSSSVLPLLHIHQILENQLGWQPTSNIARSAKLRGFSKRDVPSTAPSSPSECLST